MEIKEFTFWRNPRLFKIGSRIKIYHNDKWWKGTVDHFKPWRWKHFKAMCGFILKDPKVEIMEEEIDSHGIRWVTYDDYHNAYMYIKLDEKVGESTDLFNGYGLRANPGGDDIIFEDEPEYTPPPFLIIEEIREFSSEDAEDLPF